MSMARRARPLLALRHLTLVVIAFVMLVPFYWVVKTAITNENIYEYPPSLLPKQPHLFNFVDVWYLIPFPRYLLNSIVVSALRLRRAYSARNQRPRAVSITAPSIAS